MPVPTHGPDCYARTYPTTCPRCEVPVFYFSCSCGSKVFFDIIDPECVEHECFNFRYFFNTDHTEAELYEMGLSALKRNNARNAEVFFATSVLVNPLSADAWMCLSNILSKDSERKFCLQAFIKIRSQNKSVSAILSKMRNVNPEMPDLIRIIYEQIKLRKKKDEPRVCPFCGDIYPNRDTFRAHMHQNHREDWQKLRQLNPHLKL